MKCHSCAFEAAESSKFCPNCGAQTAPQGTFRIQILAALKDPLFLVVCILLSVSCLMSLAAGSVPLINILIAVFLWLTYAQARKDNVDAEHLRCVSGAVFAQYVISYVVAGLVLVVGLLFSVGLGIISGSAGNIWNMVLGELSQDESVLSLLELLPSISGAIIIIVCAIASVIMVVVNVFTTRYLHRFIKSLYRSIEQDTYTVECVKAAKIVLFILGGFTAAGCLSDLASGEFVNFAANASSGGCAIVAGLLIRNYLDPEV